MDKLNFPDIGDIDYVSKDVVSLWQKIIRYNGQPTEVDIDMNYNQHKSNLLGHLNSFIGLPSQ